MKQQLLTLQQLIEVMDPELFRHLGGLMSMFPERDRETHMITQTEKTDGLNLFFCFRWVLIAFKREFPFDDVLRLWEVLWTDYYTADFILFVALAILESHRDMILRYLVEVGFASIPSDMALTVCCLVSSTKYSNTATNLA